MTLFSPLRSLLLTLILLGPVFAVAQNLEQALKSELEKKEIPGISLLVVGHSNTIPAMANWLLGKEELSQLGEKDYGDLFVISYKKGKARLVKSKF